MTASLILGHGVLSEPSVWAQWQVQVAVIGALITALLAVLQAAAGLMQRRHESRVKQAETGTKLVEEMLEESNDALLMLDIDEAEYELDDGKAVKITAADVSESLRQPVTRDDAAAIFVRESFDTLLYYLDRCEHFIQTKLTRFADVQTPTEYYVAYMAEERSLFERYIEVARFHRVGRFLARFSVWSESRPKPSPKKRSKPKGGRARPGKARAAARRVPG